MQVEMTVKINGQVVREHVEQVSGTLEELDASIGYLEPRRATEKKKKKKGVRLTY